MAHSPEAGRSRGTVVRWILDTRNLWPEAAQTGQLEQVAGRTLALLSDEERAKTLRYYHVRDAKLNIGSCLLKRYLISRYCGVSWRDANAVPNGRKKPVFLHPDTGAEPVAFNVSHQDGLVVLAAVYGNGEATGDGYPLPVDVGVDVVSLSERRDRDVASIRKDGWPQFVDIYSEVLSPLEVKYLKTGVIPDPKLSADAQTDVRLRYFYALWCLREAYVKMTGDALLAAWLHDLQFRNMKPPQPGQAFTRDATSDDGVVVRDFDIVMDGKLVRDCQVELRSLGPDYMVCMAVRTPQHVEDGLELKLGGYRILDLGEILAFGEAQGRP